jgi:butyrate kinase
VSKKFKVLAINPGSTSTKIAVYEEEKCLFEEVIRHSTDEISAFADIYAQYDYRRVMVEKALLKHGFAVSDLDAVVGRGGALKPIDGGTYAVNDIMEDDLHHRVQTQHASNLGGLIARGLAAPHALPAFIVDPVCVDEMEPIARISGWPEMPRRSLFHALNLKATARRAAQDLGKNFEDVTLVMGHLGGGISFAVQQNGRMIDISNPMDGGAFSPERTGYLPPQSSRGIVLFRALYLPGNDAEDDWPRRVDCASRNR